MRTFVFSCFTAAFGFTPNTNLSTTNIYLQQQVTGIITDNNGQPIPGANIVEKGTNNGVQSDFDGSFTLTPSRKSAILVFSYVGFKTKEVSIDNQTNIKVILEEDISALEEVVVVGYGTRKKTTVTSAISQIDAETFEDRPISNVTQGLQGAVGNLVISNNEYGGEPGAGQSFNIRGLMTSVANNAGTSFSAGNAEPLVIIDGAVMSINDINPADIESVSVLKDAASAAIYGSRAAAGAILITTKSGKNMNGGMKITYSNNFSLSTPTEWPQVANALDFAYTMNDAFANQNGGTQYGYYSEEELGWIQQNMANPGSAPTIVANATNTGWDYNNFGLGASGSTDWKDYLFSDYAEKSKHDLSFRGGDEKLNYYISAGAYAETGLLKVRTNTYNRYNLDAKIAAKPNKWLSFELLTKVTTSKAIYPWDYQYGRGRLFDLISKLKPTLPIVDPTYGDYLPNIPNMDDDGSRETNKNNQINLLPRVTIEPIKDWLINLQYNYRRNNNQQTYQSESTYYTLPSGELASIISQDQTQYNTTMYTNEYFSPNLFTSYTKSIDNHNFDVTAGYQSEEYKQYNLYGYGTQLLTDNVASISTTVGEQTVADAISDWATQSIFGRIGYNYKEKYIARVTYRRDGSSKFEPGKQWGGFPSFELGYNIAKENFWPVKDISMFKLRATKGSLGNQNVANYLYLSTLSASTGNYLFNGDWDYYINAPDLKSVNLTWETVNTSDIGIDILALNNKLGFTFDWYRSDIENMATTGPEIPATLGAESPFINGGISRTQGWEAEITWKHKIGNFNYNVRAVLSDYKQTIEEFPGSTGLITGYYPGKDLNEIWGLTWEGWFQNADEVTERSALINQTWVNNTGTGFTVGDAKYADLDGNGVINRGDSTVENPGDFKVIGNSTPRYQYGITLGADYKGFDFSMFIQGIGKRDIAMATSALFKGPAQGPLHATAYVEHLDYFRPEDTTNPLGPNLDAYFAAPYAVANARNNRNYAYQTDHFLQNGAYTRLKNLQIGFTIPKSITEKYNIDRFRIFVTGENLLTIEHLLFYDPETVNGSFSNGASYPLSKTFSTGINLSF